MKVFAYERYSTGRQDEQEQDIIIRRYCEAHRLEIDEVVSDRAVSGKTSWTDRNLAELVTKMKKCDMLIVSEASRLSRSMADFSEFLNTAMRKIGGRLVVCNMGLDIDCGNLTAMVEIQLQMLMFAAQMERELISGRTKAALDARRKSAEIYGGWTAKSGEWRTGFGRPDKGYTSAQLAERRRRKREVMEERVPEAARKIMELHRIGLSNVAIARQLNEEGMTTEAGRVWHDTKVRRVIDMYNEA